MIKYSNVIDENNVIYIHIDEGEYEGLTVAIYSLNYDEKGVSYNIGLPSDKTSLRDNENFMSIIDNILFDIIQRAFENANDSYKLIIETEVMIEKLLTENKISFDTSTESLVNQFTAKKMIPYIKDKNVWVHNEENGLEYDLSKPNNLKKIIEAVFPKKIILQ